MHKHNLQLKSLSLDFLIFFYFILMAGNGCEWFSTYDPRYNPVGTFLLLAILFYLWYRTKAIKSSKYVPILAVILVAWTCYHYFVDSAFQYYTYGIFLLKIFLGGLIVKRYGYRIPEYYAKSIYILSAIGCVCWGLIMLGATPLLQAISIVKSEHASLGSIVVYNIPDVYARYKPGFLGLYRNPGFAWEPGMYASLLVLGIFFYMLVKGRDFKYTDKHFWIMVLALFTTMSTTGYVGFLVLIGLHFICGSKMKPIKKVIVVALFGVFTSYVMTMPFMSEKIESSSDSSNFVTDRVDVIKWHESQQSYFTVDRFEGMVLDLFDIQHSPIAGSGLAQQDSYISKYISKYMITSNGVTKPLAQLGLVLGILLLMFFINGGKRILQAYDYPFPYMLFVVFMVVSVSYNHFYNPIIFAIVFFTIYLPQKRTNQVQVQ